MKKLFEFIETLSIAFLAVTFILLFRFRIIQVSGSSMKDTLQEDEKVLISNISHTYERGDIVVTDPNTGSGKILIKRVIGLGGDTVRIDYSTGTLYLNGVSQNEEYIREPMEYSNEVYEITVPEGYLFLLGDNRNISIDSRNPSIGPVNEENILGKVVLRISPLTRFGPVK
jgi:signal peptidase I